MSKYELYHYGILGMKWGIRRYQNEDGSLTAAGKKRYENDDGSLNDKGKEFYRQADSYRRSQQKAGSGSSKASETTLAQEEMAKVIRSKKLKEEYDKVTGADKDSLKDAEKAAHEAAKGIQTLANLEKQTRPKPTREKLDLSSMSDDDMRKKINRELLERQYNDMFAPVKVNKGREYLGGALAVAGGVATTAATALSIAVSIKKLRE